MSITRMKFENYSSIRNQLNSGDILLCSGDYPMSKLIRNLTRSDFSHVAFPMWVGERLMVFESVESIGVRIVPLSTYANNYNNSKRPYEGQLFIGRHQKINTLLKQNNFENDAIKSLMHYALDLMGRKYDQRELAQIALRLVTGLSRHKDDEEFICSEYVEACFNRVGVSFQHQAGGYIMPKDFGQDPHINILYEIVQ